MNQLFVDRDVELKFLEEKYLSEGSQLLIIYGRRRIGKTSLLLKFVENKPYIYFLCEKTSIRMNLLKMARRMAEYLGRDSFSRIMFTDWEDLFREFFEWKTDLNKVVIIIDEFPYLIEIDRGIVSIFQKIWDEIICRRNDVMLILCGSSIGMMERKVLGYRSPLYSRRTGQWKIGELNIKSIWKFIPNYNFINVLYVYGAFGGIPAYLIKLNSKLDFYNNVLRLFFNKGGVLYEEAENLLRQELREPRNYMLILRALSEGYRRVSEIANITGIDKAAVSRYLDVLEMLEIVDYEIPILERPKTKKRYYFIRDNYFNFWFRYVYPNRDLIEEEQSNRVLSYLKNDYDNYMGRIFEHIARKFLIRNKELPLNLFKIGRHWGRNRRGETYEIDLLGLSGRGEFLIVEVKWSNLMVRDVERIVNNLSIKVDRAGLDGKIVYCIVARNIEDKSYFRNKGILVYDLEDIERSSI